MFKRLSFEKIKNDDNTDSERIMKGFMRELSTPINSLPYSNYGSRLFLFVDKPLSLTSAQNRTEIVRLSKKSTYADKIEIESISLQESDITGTLKQQINIKIINNNEHLTADLFL